MNVTYSVRVGDKVCVFVRGQLVMKRWLKTDAAATFHVALAGVQWNNEKRSSL